MLKIIIDENIAYASEAFQKFGQVSLLPGNMIINQELKSADILIVRSVTKVDETLLEKTPIKFVGTTTIGTDHIDIEYLNKNNIAFADAKGCNAYSVAEYVVAALLYLGSQLELKLSEMTIGIIGVGNIGQKVADFTKALGLNVLLNDPPLQRKSNDDLFRPLDEIFEADIISLHVPLYMAGLDKTFHLFNEQNLNRLNKNAILINTSRGAVIDNDALGDIIDKKNLNVVLDVWENEPGINVNLLKKVIIGTPHIAGYSWEGKLNGTKMIYNSLCDYLHAENNFKFGKDNTGETLKFLKFSTLEKSLNDLISKIYDIKTDDKLNRKMIHKSKNEQLLFFHEMRKNYYARKEFNNFKIAVGNETGELKEMLEKLRFKVVN